jgi:eukaryotic-like serine/threonine-protein kinase
MGGPESPPKPPGFGDGVGVKLGAREPPKPPGLDGGASGRGPPPSTSVAAHAAVGYRAPAAAIMSLQLSDGSVFASRYQVVRRIAMGGMGAVYEVEHLETLRRLALKVMLPHIVQSTEMRDRFRREARVAAHIESEHIVAVLDAGIDDATGMPFMVMELLRGEELAQALRRVGRFGPAEVVTFLHQASLALDKTHRAYIVHRDLKPENLFLTEREDGQPRIKVLDFGIAKLVAEGSTQDPSTRSLGTPLYMAPEQFRAGQPISPATDVYALGMIAYTLLVGSSYWAEEAKNSSNVFVFAGGVMAGPRELATVRSRRQGVPLPASFDAWFSRVTAVGPGDRFPSAPAAVSALAEALGVPAPGASVGGTGVLRGFGATPAAAAPPAPLEPDAAATMVYLGGATNPLATPSATGPQGVAAAPPGAPLGPASTGSAYGSTAGLAPQASSVSTGKLVAAVVGGVALGGAALVAFLVLHPGSVGGPGADGSAAPRSAGSPEAKVIGTVAPTVSASAPAAPSAVPAAPPVTPPVAAAPASASASAPVRAGVPAAPGTGHRAPAAPPADTGKKSIFVRD